MRAILLHIILISLSGFAFCTEQVPDFIIIDKDTLELKTFPLEDCKTMKYEGYFDWNGTACYRGYNAVWRLRNDSLFLVSLRNCYYAYEGIDDKKIVYPLQMFFDNVAADGTVYADWYSGTLYIEKQINFSKRPYFKNLLYIGIDSGKYKGLGERLSYYSVKYEGYKSIGSKSYRFEVLKSLDYNPYFSGYLSDTLCLETEKGDIKVKAYYFKSAKGSQIEDSYFDHYIENNSLSDFKRSELQKKGNVSWIHCTSKMTDYSIQIYSKGENNVLIEIWLEGSKKAILDEFIKVTDRTLKFID